MTSFLDFFQTTVGTITRGKRNLVDVAASTTIHEAIGIFNRERVSTIPIFEAAVPTSEPSLCYDGRCYIGMLSMADIAVYIMSFAKSFIVQEGSGKTVTECLADPVCGAIGCSQESNAYFGLSVTYEDTPLSLVVDRMCIGMHRCLVCREKGESPRVLTQTDIVKFFLANVHNHPQISTALSQLVGNSSHGTMLVTVLDHSPIVHAFEKMQFVSALAIVNQSGQVVGNLSAVDLCALTNSTDFNAIVSMSVREFLKMLSSNGHSLKAVICATNDMKLLDCMRGMIDNRIHRMWITADDDEIDNYGTGCVSLTDIIQAVSQHSTVLIAGDYII